jgi:hypothetical protein
MVGAESMRAFVTETQAVNYTDVVSRADRENVCAVSLAS